MAGWHHRLDGCEFEWTPGVGGGQGSLACCDLWGCKESDTTERLNWTVLILVWLVFVLRLPLLNFKIFPQLAYWNLFMSKFNIIFRFVIMLLFNIVIRKCWTKPDICILIYSTSVIIKTCFSDEQQPYHLGTCWQCEFLNPTCWIVNSWYSSVQFRSVAQSCRTLCDPMDCSTPGLPVHHQLPEFTQTHVHWVGDTIQPSHPLLSLP